jgi:hypothetical protein
MRLQGFTAAVVWGSLIVILLAVYAGNHSLAQDTFPTLTPPPDQTAAAVDLMSTQNSTPLLEVTLEPEETNEVLTPAASPTPYFETEPIALPTYTLGSIDTSGAPQFFIKESQYRERDSGFLTVLVSAQALPPGSSLTLICRADPASLWGIQAVPGELLPLDSYSMVDFEYQPDGIWRFGAEHIPAYTGASGITAGTLWTLNFQVIGTGSTLLICEITPAGLTGQPLALLILPLELSTLELPPTNSPLTSTIAADVLVLPTMPQEVTPNALPHTPSLVIVPADINANGRIDLHDSDLIIQYYGMSIPTAPLSVDVNRDGIVDLLDLVLVGSRIAP